MEASDSPIVEGNPESKPIRVTVTDLDIGMINMIGLLIKFAIAAIPAAIILVIIGALVAGFWTAILRQI